VLSVLTTMSPTAVAHSVERFTRLRGARWKLWPACVGMSAYFDSVRVSNVSLAPWFRRLDSLGVSGRLGDGRFLIRQNFSSAESRFGLVSTNGKVAVISFAKSGPTCHQAPVRFTSPATARVPMWEMPATEAVWSPHAVDVLS
jgi:hypothetical protein